MIKDKYSAVWVSHSSMSDYLKCPRLYYLKNIYRHPPANHKINIIQPALALGQVVHDVIDSISTLPTDERFKMPLISVYNRLWKSVSGKLGGFKSEEEEKKTKESGLKMIRRITDNPGPISRKAIKIRQNLPYFWLSEEDDIILCGKIDWLEYVEEKDGVRIIDFKTGKYDEDPDSLQLPIYYLLVKNCQSKNIIGASYWYLERDDQPMDLKLPDYQESVERIMEIAKRIALARKLDRFVCKNEEGCFFCKPYEDIVKGKGEFVGVNDYKQGIYTI